MLFQLHSDKIDHDHPLPRNDRLIDLRETTRHRQEVRALLRFGAFLVNRHTNLDLLGCRPDSGLAVEKDNEKPARECYIDVEANSLRIRPERCVQHPQHRIGFVGRGSCDCTKREVTSILFTERI